MNDHGLVHALRSGAGRLVDALTSPDGWRLFGSDPIGTASSVCQHAWIPSPGGPAEYCGRCGAVRPLTAGWHEREILYDDASPAPPRVVGPIDWPEEGPPAPVTAQAADEDRDYDVELVEPAPPTARTVGPQSTWLGTLTTPGLTHDVVARNDHRSPIRLATLVAVLLSLGALVGFVGADLTRDSRDLRGVAAVSPTETPERSSAEPTTGAPARSPGATMSGEIEEPTPTATPSDGPPMDPPVARLGSRLTSGGIELDVVWQPPTDGSAASRYDLGVARDSGSYEAVALEPKTSRRAQVAATANHVYAFRLRARGKDGSKGPYASTTVRLTRVEEAGPEVRASKGWKVAQHPAYTGGGARYSSTPGAELSLAFDGTGAAIIGPKGPGRGRAEVFIDGERAGRIDAIASTFEPTRLLFKADTLEPGPHVLTIRVARTAGRPMVAIDRFLVLGQP